MNIITASLLLVFGLILLWKSAEFLVSGAVGLAGHFGISPLVIGLTIVAMGTSAPEVAASIASAIRGLGDVAVANVYGSNIANLALVGGVAAIIRPIPIKGTILVRQMPVMLLVAILLWPVLSDLHLTRLEGVSLLVVFGVLLALVVCMAKKGSAEDRQIAVEPIGGKELRQNLKKSVLFITIGLVGLALAAEMTVRGAVFLGQLAGLSHAVIGLTIIAVGTSLPELATCVVAAVKGHDEISIGNLVGSNVFNTLLVTGSASVLKPFSIVPRLAGVDYLVMIIVSVVFITIAVIWRRIGRPAGIILFCGYICYVVHLLVF